MAETIPPFPVGEFPTPCYVLDLAKMRRNMAVMADVKARTGCRILLALKGFATWKLFPLLAETLDGTTASGPHEARLGAEKFGGETHVYAPGFSAEDMETLLPLAGHINFNSLRQWRKFRGLCEEKGIQCGLRINPRYSEVENTLYDPCAPGSRLGVPWQLLEGEDLEGLGGFHFHTLCEQNAGPFERTVEVIEKNLGSHFAGHQWVNFGGGHHITRDDYEVARLVATLNRFRERHPHLTVYLEPGEASVLHAGYLVASVVDVVENGIRIAILDTSATAHMPDVLEMPYRPSILGAGEPGEFDHTFRLGGLTCLAGDVIGDYSFPEPLEEGSRLVFTDMAHYTIVKNTMFNGIQLPAIATWDAETATAEVIREFDFADYASRLS